MSNSIFFGNLCRENHLVVNDLQNKLLDKYVRYLLEWNKKINLLSRKDTENIWIKHILGSIALMFKHKLVSDANIIDVGTGGGLPGIPLAILNPDSKFMLADSIQKKIKAVDDIIKNLGIHNIQTYCGRAEEIGMKRDFAHHYDYVIARAVASITEIVRWCKPFLRISSTVADTQSCVNTSMPVIKTSSIILLKGGELESEIAEAKIKVSPRNLEVYPIVIQGIDTTELFDKKIVIIQP